MNHVQTEITGPDGRVHARQDEALDPLINGIWTPGEHPHATISFLAGKSLGYGELKVSVNVTLQCDQNTQALEQAATQAFAKAVHYLTAGFTMLSSEAGKAG